MQSTTADDKHAALRAAVGTELNTLSDRELARQLGVSQSFVSTHREKYAPRPKRVRGRDGRVRSRPRPASAREDRTVPLIEWLETYGELKEARREIVRLQQQPDLHAAEIDKLRRQIKRYQDDLARRRRQPDHYARQLAAKLAWVGFEPDEAIVAMGDGVLVGPVATADLNERERELFRELWTDMEGRAQRHYLLKWMREGLTDVARESAIESGITGRAAINEAVEEARAQWILDRIEEDPFPWSGSEAADSAG